MKHPTLNKEKRLSTTLIVLSSITLVISAVLLYLRTTGINTFCGLALTCETGVELTNSIAGASIALLSLIVSAMLLLMTVHVYTKTHIKKHLGKRISATLLVIMLFFSTLYAIYLIVMQMYLISIPCLLCLTLAAIILASFIVSILLFREVVR